MSKPLVLTYQDYRSFLNDLYCFEKRTRGKYSYRKFCADLGFGPSNYLHLVITGKRNLSLKGIETIKQVLDWTTQEKNYFHTLVLYNQAKPEDKIGFKDELDKILRKKRVKLNPDQFAYFSTWYIPVIREIVSLKSFVSNLNWISKKLRPHVDEALVKRALEILQRLNMIFKPGGKWLQNHKHLTTDTEVTSDMVYNYHKEMLKLSLHSLEHPCDQRDISAMTMSLSPKQFAWLKQRIIDFRDELQQELQQINEEQTLVGQLNIQFFKVTED